MSCRANNLAAAESKTVKPKRTARRKSTLSPPPGSLGKEVSREANRRAAAVLEVLGGFRMPSEAAAALGISVNHYYLLERKALAGLLAACEPQPKGPREPSTEKKLKTLERELETCRRECMRQTALVRATQRAVGLPAVPSSSKKRGKAAGKAGGKKTLAAKRHRRHPTVRALRAAETVRQNSSGENSAGELEKRPEGATEETSRTIEKEQERDAQG
jgi:hypothetical protein